MKKVRVKSFLTKILILAFLLAAGFIYFKWSSTGLYSDDWQPKDVYAYWLPGELYQSITSLRGIFGGAQCVACHQAVTPGIYNDWKASKHAKLEKKIYCSDCHGNNHQELRMPTPKQCGKCHQAQHTQFEDEKHLGFSSHALAMERAIEANHFIDKPKAEVAACLQCHSVATKCDSCHTRHKFNAAEARRPEACITCHSGPPHPDDTTFFHSKHGQLYVKEGHTWDWSKPLRKGNYKGPTCAYCHMDQGQHQVAHKSIWKSGVTEINPSSSSNKVKRKQWLKLCTDCHEQALVEKTLTDIDAERKQSWNKLYAAEAILKELQKDNSLFPMAEDRPLYPNSKIDQFFPYERIGFSEAQASAFYNVSPIERDFFEMWYFSNLIAYKGLAHGDSSSVTRGHEQMDKALASIKLQAKALKDTSQASDVSLSDAKIREELRQLWLKGEYTEYNKENN